MNNEKCCWTCKYHYLGEKYWECDNDKSSRFQFPVNCMDVCEEYEESNWHKKERIYERG